jgi:hypothetical protein
MPVDRLWNLAVLFEIAGRLGFFRCCAEHSTAHQGGTIVEGHTACNVFRSFHTCGGDGGFVLNTYN